MIYWLLYSIPDEASIPYIFSTILSTRVATSREHCIWTPRTLCTSMLFRVLPCCLDFLFIFDLPNCNTSHLICHFSPMCNWFISCSILWQSSSQSAIPPILLCHLQTNQPIYSFCPSHLYISQIMKSHALIPVECHWPQTVRITSFHPPSLCRLCKPV